MMAVILYTAVYSREFAIPVHSYVLYQTEPGINKGDTV